jgi:hypothetical protein
VYLVAVICDLDRDTFEMTIKSKSETPPVLYLIIVCFDIHSTVGASGRHIFFFFALFILNFYIWVLGTLFVAYIIISICIPVPLCACFTTIFNAYFPVVSLRLSLVSGACIVVII